MENVRRLNTGLADSPRISIELGPFFVPLYLETPAWVPCAGAFLLGSVYCEAAHQKSRAAMRMPSSSRVTAKVGWRQVSHAWTLHVPSLRGPAPVCPSDHNAEAEHTCR